jgi:ATP-dependent RNA helicase DDX27
MHKNQKPFGKKPQSGLRGHLHRGEMVRDDGFIMTLDDEPDEAERAAPDEEDDRVEFAFAGASSIGARQPALGKGVKPGSKLSSFDTLNLERPLLKAVENAGFEQPTKIQELAIPLILSGGDVCGTAVTGSGKTAAFMLPVLQRLLHRSRRSATTAALVLLPTRELAMQCHAMTAKLARYTSVQSSLIVGGLSLKLQEAELRSRPDLVISTPGRLIDLVRNSPAVTLESIEVLVLDEADRLLELGFRAELDEIIKMTPRGRQTLLFTATISPAVEELIAASLNRPASVKVNEEMGVATTLLQEFVRVGAEHASTAEQPAGGKVRKIERESILLSLCARSFTAETLIFTRSRAQAHRLAALMRACGLKVRAAQSAAGDVRGRVRVGCARPDCPAHAHAARQPRPLAPSSLPTIPSRRSRSCTASSRSCSAWSSSRPFARGTPPTSSPPTSRAVASTSVECRQ